MPVSRSTGTEKTADVLLAGMLNETVLEPVENITRGSSAADTAVGANDSVRVPESAVGKGADNANPIGTCCVGFNSPGTPVKVNEGALGLLIVSVNACSAVCCGERLSVT